jgi:hypothetical protein
MKWILSNARYVMRQGWLIFLASLRAQTSPKPTATTAAPPVLPLQDAKNDYQKSGMKQVAKSHLQKLELLSNSRSEYINGACIYLKSLASQHNHAMIDFTTIECGGSSLHRYEVIHSYCSQCILEMKVEYGVNETGLYSSVEIDGPDHCTEK